MNEHECFIGLFFGCENPCIITTSELKEKIRERKEDNKMLRAYGNDWAVKKEWSLKDYADRRKSTDMMRFDFCPVCGNKIKWNEIARDSDGEE